jgi:hypothetical protein
MFWQPGPTDPADWPAVKDVYKDYFLIGNTNLSAANFGANVVPGENSTAAMTVKHFNVVTPDNAMKPDSLWGGGIATTTPAFLTNLTSGINKDIKAANARGFKVNAHTIICTTSRLSGLQRMSFRLKADGKPHGIM